MNSKIIENLKRLSLTEQEAIAYMVLLMNSPMSGYAVALESKIPKSKIYEVLESLIKKGAVAISRSTSSQYIAIPYENFLERYRAQQAQHRSTALSAYESYSMYLENAKDNANMIWNIYRIQDIYAQLSNLIDASEKNIMMKLWAKDIQFLEKSLEGAFRRGVKLYLIVMGKYENSLFPCNNYTSLVFDSEHQPYRSLRAEFDEKTICCCSIVENGQSYAAWTTNPILLRPVHASLISDMSIFQLYTAASTEQQALWGEDLINIWKHYS